MAPSSQDLEPPGNPGRFSFPWPAIANGSRLCTRSWGEAYAGRLQAVAATMTGMNATRERALQEVRRMVLDALGDRKAEIWLFGSCARGDVRQHSDIDVAILPREPLPAAFLAE